MGQSRKRSSLFCKIIAQTRAISTWKKEVRNEPIVDLKKIFLPPLRFKLGMMKNSLKTMVHEGKGF
jgi:hypothetical protein